MTTATTTATFTRTDAASLLGGGGIVGLIAAHVTGITAVGFAATVMLGLGALLAMSSGWFVGLAPATAAASVSLIGAQVRVGGDVLTVVDDATPSAVAAMRGGGGRCSVAATDAGGRVGWLFLGLDRRGRITEAATETAPWQPM